MFYKHWKKIALALTGFFWNSCDNSVTSADANGVNPSSTSIGDNQSSSSEVTPSSSNDALGNMAPLYGILLSSVVQSSSSNAESSSSFVQPVPAYGVVAVPCYEDGKGVKMSAGVTETKLVCDDGVFCNEREAIKKGENDPCRISDEGDLKGAVACPDYGVVYVTEKTYDCDGVTYNEAEFRERYEKAEIVKIDKKIEDRLNSEKNED